MSTLNSSRPHRARRALALFVIMIVFGMFGLGCVVPPTAVSLGHTGRLAQPGGAGTFRVGGTTNFADFAGPELSWRYRIANRLELDTSGYALINFGDEDNSTDWTAMGRLGLGISLFENERGAIALLAGFGMGGLHNSYRYEVEGSGEGALQEANHFIMGGDLGIAGSLRFGNFFEPYVGVRCSVTGPVNDSGDPEPWVWLLPAIGFRFLLNEMLAFNVEWSNGIAFFDDDATEWLSGLTIGFEFGRNGRQMVDSGAGMIEL